MTISDKISKIIDLKCGGNHAMLAEIMGVKTSYISKLKGGDVGLGMQQLKRLLTAFPDLNPRWLILDDENEQILDRNDLVEVKIKLYDNIKAMLDIEQYLPFMTKQELEDYSNSIKGLNNFEYKEDQIKRWKASLNKSDHN